MGFSTTRRITAASPRLTRTSVTGSAMPARPEIASRCAWLLVLAIVQQIGFGKSAGNCVKHRPGDRDVIVVREPPHHGDRRVADRRQPVGQLGTRLGFDLGDQPAEHVVEQSHVILVEAARPIEKEVP